MIKQNRVLAVITARGGSKGLPGKNIRPLAGKPLLAWTIEAAQQSRYIDHCILSSDDSEIIDVARQYGCDVPFIRPAELSSDTALSIDVVQHAIQAVSEQYDYLVLLQPTSPLRTANDIDCCLELCLAKQAASCASVVEIIQHPYLMRWCKGDGEVLVPVVQAPAKNIRRQDMPPVYMFNGAIYVNRIANLMADRAFVTEETIAYIMPENRSVDIDDLSDFQKAEQLMQQDVSHTGRSVA